MHMKAGAPQCPDGFFGGVRQTLQETVRSVLAYTSVGFYWYQYHSHLSYRDVDSCLAPTLSKMCRKSMDIYAKPRLAFNHHITTTATPEFCS